MLNFSYSNPTRLVFGRDAELQVGAQALAVLGGKAKVLVLFGGGSARRTGILDAVEKSLEDAGFCVIEKGGVQPNPRMASCATRLTGCAIRGSARSLPWAAVP